MKTLDSYTKHYFVDNERFASRIGDGNFSEISTHSVPDSLLTAKQTITNNAAPQRVAPNKFSFLNSLSANWSTHHTTYWQHPDHLGSTSWVTDTNGRGYQHLQYRAWGEPFIEQNSTANGYETRYTFSGKERDEETGFSYFGSRYYNSSLSIWLSVDPMSDKYPSMSPYTYCANNPVKLVDPNGREIWIDNYLYTPGEACPEDAAENTRTKWNTLNAIYMKKNGDRVIDEMSDSKIFKFNISSEKNLESNGLACYTRESKTSGIIYLNGNDDDIGTLSHELFHGYQHLRGQPGHTIFNEIEANMFSYSITKNWENFSYDAERDIQKTGSFQQEGMRFTQSYLKLITADEYNQLDFDYVHDNFQKWSRQNWSGEYNSYSITYPNESLIKEFYPLK